MPEIVHPTPPEKLRLLRLRSCLEVAVKELDNAQYELHVTDTFTIAAVKACDESRRALILVVGSLQAFDEAGSEAVE